MEIGMDFESAVFGVLCSNIEDHQKRQACLQGVMDCVRKWGEADQLPIPARKDNRPITVASGFLSPDVTYVANETLMFERGGALLVRDAEKNSIIVTQG
jgi:hypothetical protein